MLMKNVTIENASWNHYIIRAVIEKDTQEKVVYECTSLDDCIIYLSLHNALQNADLEPFLSKVDLVLKIREFAEVLARQEGYTVDSIGRITKSSGNSNVFEVVEKSVKYKKFDWVRDKSYRQLVFGLSALAKRIK